jgi:drug/metabolite transporter (DMT)-like permease
MVVFGVALVPQVFGQGLIAYGLAQLPVAFVSVSLLIQPVMATIWAWLLLAEPLGPVQALGGAVVLAGIWIARRGSARS